MRIFINELKSHIGEKVTVKGWITVRRDQGKLVFFDIRDMTGTVQGVVLPKSEAISVAKDVNRESAVSITGTLNKRPEKNVDADKENGDIELAIDGIEVLGAAKTLPYEISEDTSNVAEEVRLEYRYLDLRSERMQRNIRMRSEFVRRVREYLFAQKFTEIETAAMCKASPFLAPTSGS
jgi:aspartyl-tRNA synthetase